MAKYKNVQSVDEKTMALAQNAYKSTKLAVTLEKIGIHLDGDGKTPMSADAPRVFAVKDGKAVTLEEGGMKIDSTAFIEALMKGQIFAYPNGKTEPVQLRGSAVQKQNTPVPEFNVTITDPLNADDPRNDLREEPEAKPAPKWYHRLFSFVPSNRRRIDEYAQYQSDHAAWEQEKQELQEKFEISGKKNEIDVVNAVKKKFGAKRDAKSLHADKEMQERVNQDVADREADTLEDLKVNGVEKGIDLMVSVYRSHPEAKEEWLKEFPGDDRGYYQQKDFDKLTSANIDPTKVEIGGQGLTEREFATMAMFAATNVETSLEQQKVAVGDPTNSIKNLQKAGYTEAQAERLVADANNTAFTVDILHRDNRMYKNFPAVNSGRDLAAKALAVYPLKKGPLAEILSRAVEQGGMRAATTADIGAVATAKLAGEMLQLMERDPELKEMAKQSFEQREREFCQNTRIPQKKWDDLVQNIERRAKFEEVRQKGFEGRAALLRARAQGKELSPEQKKGYVRDILAGNMVDALRENQVAQSRREPANEKWQDFNHSSMLDEYTRLMNLDAGGDRGLGAQSGGSTMASNAAGCLISAVTDRVLKTPAVMTMVTKPEEMEKLRNTMDKIIEADHLADKSVDELAKNLASDTVYETDRILDKAVKAEKPAVEAQLNGPSKQREAEKKIEAPKIEEPKAAPTAPTA